MIDMFRAVPEFKKIVVEIVDREKLDLNVEASEGDQFVSDWKPPTKRVAFLAYVKGPGTPVPVELEVNRIIMEYERDFPGAEVLNALPPAEQWYMISRANSLYHLNLLTSIAPKLGVEDAQSLVSDGSARRILELCKWVPSVDTEEVDEEPDDKGEGVIGQ